MEIKLFREKFLMFQPAILHLSLYQSCIILSVLNSISVNICMDLWEGGLIFFLQKKFFQNYDFVGTNLGPNCWQKLSAANLRVNKGLKGNI